MGDSLQDQLRALGLAREKAPKPGGPRARKKSRDTKSGGQMSLEKAYALKARAEKQQAARARRSKLEEDRRRRLLNQEIREIVEAHGLDRAGSEVSRHFMFRGRIRKINLKPDQLRALNAGELGIVYLSGGYHLLFSEGVEAVRALSADHVVDFGDESQDDGDHPVPDDLVW